MRGAILRVYAWLIGYRFRESLKDTLELPVYYEKLEVEVIRAKAATSLNAAGVFLALSIAVLVVVMSLENYGKSLTDALRGGWQSITGAIFSVAIPYLAIRQERIISAEGEKGGRYFFLFCFLGASLFVFLIAPLTSRMGCPVFGALFSPTVLRPALILAGFVLILASAICEVFAVELYDSAAGWRGGNKLAGAKLRFHLAGLASHSFIFGLSFALLGISLLLAQVHFWIGSCLGLVTLFALVMVTEIERELWMRKE
jgi:hypothetical protein